MAIIALGPFRQQSSPPWHRRPLVKLSIAPAVQSVKTDELGLPYQTRAIPLFTSRRACAIPALKLRLGRWIVCRGHDEQ